jgi:endoglucanase
VGGAAGGTAAGSGGRSVGGTAVDAGMAGGTATTGGRTGGTTPSGGNSGGSKPMGGSASTGGTAGGAKASGGTTAASSGDTSDFHCVNWADTGDNFQNGVLQPSGLVAASDTYATVKAKSDAILSGFQTLLKANTIRIPINEPTVVTNAAWWTAYKGIIDSAISKNMKVIIGYWAIKGGTLADPNSFYTMWQTVIDAYLSSDLVYFEIMNEPYALQPAAFIDFAAQWLARYPTVPHNRVVVAGDYTDTDVNKQGADPRLAGCLLSLHFYNFSTTTSTAQGWSDYLKQKVGPYYNRTIVTEYGVVMTTGINYPAPSGVATPTPAGLRRVFTPVADPTINTLYMVGTTNQMREWKMGSCLWVGLRNNDTTSITKLSGTGTNLSLTVTNPSALTLIQWGWGL